jgi:hypothetical protein
MKWRRFGNALVYASVVALIILAIIVAIGEYGQ